MPTRDHAFPEGTPCWIDCQVDDTGRAREFYSALFGWQIDDGPANAGGYLMALKDGRVAAGIGPKPVGMSMPSVWSTYLAADDADATSAKVTGAGGQLLMPAFDVLDVGRMTFALDPTGAAFGIWEARSLAGAAIYNEPGTYCWNELHTRDYAGAKAFYAAVFGYTYTGMQGGPETGYATFSTPSGAEPVGGIADDTVIPGTPEGPAYWLTWFAVADVSEAAERVGELGGAVVTSPMASPVGQMCVVTGPECEAFGLIELGPPPVES